MQKTFSRTAGHQTEQRLKYFLFLQSWKKKTPTVKRYTLFPKLIWSFQRRSVWYWKSPIVPNEPWHFRDTSAVTAPPWEAGLRCAPRQCSILRSVILAPTCSRGWEGTYVHKCCDKQSKTLERERITQNRRKYTQTPTKPKAQKTRERPHRFLYSKREKASCPSSKVAKNVNQTHIPYLRSSLCKTIPTETGNRVKTDKEAGDQMALRDTSGNVQTAIRRATAWRQQGSLQGYKLQNPAFTWFSHVCSQMSVTGG